MLNHRISLARLAVSALRMCALTTVLVILLVTRVAGVDQTGYYLAFSLGEAERRTGLAEHDLETVEAMGGISRLIGLVHDRDREDLVIVGWCDPNDQVVPLDHFVVALRAVHVLEESPMVSLDRTSATASTGQLEVRFRGGLQDTRFGQEMVDIDMALKKLSLGIMETRSAMIRTYLAASTDRWLQLLEASGYGQWTPNDIEAHYCEKLACDSLIRAILGQSPISSAQSLPNDYARIGSRFWFDVPQSLVRLRDGCCAIIESDVSCLTQVLYAVLGGKLVDDLSTVTDEVGLEFARSVTDEMARLCWEHPLFLRAKTLYDLVALAMSVGRMDPRPKLDFWLHDYMLPMHTTPRAVDMMSVVCRINKDPGHIRLLDISGGIELDALAIRIRDGETAALKEAVLLARPDKPGVLTWRVPLEGWRIRHSEKYYETEPPTGDRSGTSGFSLDIRFIDAGVNGVNSEALLAGKFAAPLQDDQALGGVIINPRPKLTGAPPSGLWNMVLESRPADSSMFWDLNILIDEE